MYGPVALHLDQLRHVLRRALLDRALDPFEAVHRGVRRQPVEQRLVHHRRAAGRVEHEHRHLRATLLGRARRVRTNPSISPASRYSRTLSASASMFCRRQHVLGGDRALGALGEPLRPSWPRCSSSSLGSGLKMPPGDLPVTIAQVAKVTRSAASRGGTSELSASATACWLSASAAAPARFGLAPLVAGPTGPTGRSAAAGSAGPTPAAGGSGSACGSGAGSRDPRRVSPLHHLGLRPGDLLGRLRLLVLVQLLDLVAVLDRVLDQLLDVVEAGVTHRRQLDRRQVEVVLDAVLDPHRHQRVQTQLDQRHLPRQVLGLVTHGRRRRSCPAARAMVSPESGDHLPMLAGK